MDIFYIFKVLIITFMMLVKRETSEHNMDHMQALYCPRNGKFIVLNNNK